MSDYPECERMVAVAPESQKIGEFLDWLGQQGIHLAVFEHKIECGYRSLQTTYVGIPRRRCIEGRLINDEDDDVGECGKCDGTGLIDRIDPILVPRGGSTEALLAKYFGIDQDKVDAERRQMLKALGEG